MPFEVSVSVNGHLVAHYPLHIAAKAGVALGEPEDGDEDNDDEEEQGFQGNPPSKLCGWF